MLPHYATRDHLRDRFSPDRRERCAPGERRIVLACWQCNNDRAKASQAEQPLEELRRRSMRGWARQQSQQMQEALS